MTPDDAPPFGFIYRDGGGFDAGPGKYWIRVNAWESEHNEKAHAVAIAWVEKNIQPPYVATVDIRVEEFYCGLDGNVRIFVFEAGC